MQDTPVPPATEANGRTAAAVAGRLREEITGGRFPAGEFLPPVRELAERQGVAKVTANKALKVLEAEGLLVSKPRHGYRVRAGAGDPDRGLPVAYVNTTRHQVGEGRDQFHKTLLMEFQRVAGARGWSLLTLDADSMNAAQIVEQVTAANACGVITNTAMEKLWPALRDTGMPVVVVDAWKEAVEIDCVLQDGFLGGLQACAHLIKNGHERIGWLGPGPADGVMQVLERYSGATAALARAGLALACQVDAPLGNAHESRERAQSLLKRNKGPTGILALWQDTTTAVAEAAAELGMVPGKDFEMVGWCTAEEHESSFTSRFPRGHVPALVTWSIARMADAAVARLKQRRAEPNLAPTFLRIPTTLRVGGNG